MIIPGIELGNRSIRKSFRGRRQFCWVMKSEGVKGCCQMDLAKKGRGKLREHHGKRVSQ